MLQQCVVVLVALHVSTAVQQCQTPNAQDGDCTKISDCPVLYQMLDRRPLSNRNVDYLKKSQCGFEGKIPKVCCPIGSVLPPNITDTVYTDNNVESPLLPSVPDCGSFQFDGVIDGIKASFGEIPSLALLEYKSASGKRFVACGGVLINKRYVLTAAHCIKEKNSSRTLASVRLGEHNLKTDPDCLSYGKFGTNCSPPAITVEVDEAIAHESYNPDDKNRYHDIALVRLKQEVNYTIDVGPICLPTKEDLDKSYDSERLLLSGWGIGSNGFESDTKLRFNVHLKEFNECRITYKTGKVDLRDDQLCIGGDKDGHFCRGDSGGPLLIYDHYDRHYSFFYVAGVSSFGPNNCGVNSWPVVYTRVSKYMKWITEKLRP